MNSAKGMIDEVLSGFQTYTMRKLVILITILAANVVILAYVGWYRSGSPRLLAVGFLMTLCVGLGINDQKRYPETIPLVAGTVGVIWVFAIWFALGG